MMLIIIKKIRKESGFNYDFQEKNGELKANSLHLQITNCKLTVTP